LDFHLVCSDIDDTSAKIRFHVFNHVDNRTVTKDDLLGGVEFPLIASSNSWYALKKGKMRRGKIQIELLYNSKVDQTLSPSRRRVRKRAGTLPLASSTDVRAHRSPTGNAQPPATRVLVYGTYRGACKEADCDCQLFAPKDESASSSTGFPGGACRTCSHYPSKHENLGVDTDAIAILRKSLADAHAAAMAASSSSSSSPPSSPSKSHGDAKSSPPTSPQSTLVMQSSWLVDPDELELKAQLGEGSFAKVFRGTYRGQEVAIKVLKEKADQKAMIEFKKELAIMGYRHTDTRSLADKFSVD
jgi:hypothetical protein